jgi:DNA-directed RNA polymerase specialized sigma24 family protein
VSPDPRHRAALTLIAAHDAALRRTARRHSLCGADAEDASQRAMLVALRKAPEIERLARSAGKSSSERPRARLVT